MNDRSKDFILVFTVDKVRCLVVTNTFHKISCTKMYFILIFIEDKVQFRACIMDIGISQSNTPSTKFTASTFLLSTIFAYICVVFTSECPSSLLVV